MNDHKAVRSTVEISRRIVFYLDTFDPQYFTGMSHARAVRNINDILQGRSVWTVERLLGELRKKGPGLARNAELIGQEIQDFQTQRALLKKPYKRFSDMEYDYKKHDDGSPYPLKIIDQGLYDRAVHDGFPPHFFRESYFDNVTFYCLPDVADLYRSEFHGCTFAVCRINGADFQSARIYDSTFHSCRIQNVFFRNATLAHTHFNDCDLAFVLFNEARLKHCNTTDCTMSYTDFHHAALDGCTYGRIQAKETLALQTALITQGGATAEECRRNRAAIFKALNVQDDLEPPPPRTLHVKHKRRSGPER